MGRLLTAMGMICMGLASAVAAEPAPRDYVGPFPTERLYAMCTDSQQRETCLMYLQGLMAGLRIQRNLTEQGSAVCLPEMSPEQARVRIVQLIDVTTKGRPQDNKDSGDWIATVALASGNLCKQHGKN